MCHNQYKNVINLLFFFFGYIVDVVYDRNYYHRENIVQVVIENQLFKF